MPDDETQGDPVDPLEQQLAALGEMLRGRITPDEVEQALLLVLYAMAEMKKEIDETIDGTGSDAMGAARGARLYAEEEIGKLRKRGASVRRLVDGLLEWKKEIEERGIDDDIATALEIGDTNSRAIRMLRRELKNLSRRPPKDGKPGTAPAHKWEGTRLFFQNPDGSWDDGVDLRGLPGVAHPERGGSAGPGYIGAGFQDLRSGSPNVRIENGRIYFDGAGSGHTIQDEGVALPDRSKLNFIGPGVSVADNPGDDSTDVSITATGGGSGVGVLAEKLTGVQAGADVELDLDDLTETYQTILGVFRNGQLLTPTLSWSQTGSVITIFSADAGEDFIVQFAYAGTEEGVDTEQIAGAQSGADVELDLGLLSRPYSNIIGVFRNGQLQTPATGWTQVGDIITVPNADASEDYLVQYVY